MKSKTSCGCIKKEKKIRTKNVLVKPARYKEIDTGVRQIVKIVEGEGAQRTEREEERPVYDRVLLAPVFDEREIEEDVFVVETQNEKGFTERHEFSCEEDAERYRETFKG